MTKLSVNRKLSNSNGLKLIFDHQQRTSIFNQKFQRRRPKLLFFDLNQVSRWSPLMVLVFLVKSFSCFLRRNFKKFLRNYTYLGEHRLAKVHCCHLQYMILRHKTSPNHKAGFTPCNFSAARSETNQSGAGIGDRFHKGAFWLANLVSCDREIAV